MLKVLFLCTENACRSQMAEGLINHDLGGQVQAFSAGVRATRVNPRAIQVMAEIGIDISRHRSKSVDEFSENRFDLAVTLCDQAQRECPMFLNADILIHMGFPDPAQATGTEEEILTEFRRVRDDIRQKMVAFLREKLTAENSKKLQLTSDKDSVAGLFALSGDCVLLTHIKSYNIFRPKMDAIKERLHSIATLGDDISPAFPYINAELGGWDYDQKNQVLLLKLSDGKWITLHAKEIAIRGTRDIEESEALLAWITGQINDIYARRDLITPRYSSQAALKVIEILKLLPMTNCKLCGYATCMAYATALREGETYPKDCQPLWKEKYREKREKLQAYLESCGWRPLDAH